jgi:hypothetical protein
MCLYPTLSRIIGLQIKLQNLQLTHALREIFSFLCGCLPWGRLFFLSASRFNFGFCRSLSTHFFIWFFSFSSSRQHHVSAFSFHSSLQRIVEKVARRLLVWVLQIFFFIWCYSDFLESAFSKYCRFLRSFHCLWIYSPHLIVSCQRRGFLGFAESCHATRCGSCVGLVYR